MNNIFNYVYQNPNSITKKNCEKIIDLFERETNTKYEGITQSGLNKNVKNTTDYVIDKNDNNWSDIYNMLSLELQTNIKLYINSLHANSFDEKYTYFKNTNLIAHNFMIQRYIKNYGKYTYHHDFATNNENNSYRVITFLWYLNTIDEGGETEFWGNYKIKPEQGKLMFFPSLWCYPHCGNIPLSDNKYIITGWLYEKKTIIPKLENRFIQRYNYNIFLKETECQWLINETEKYYQTTMSKCDYISFELITPVFNYILIKIKYLIEKMKEYYSLSENYKLNIKNIFFVKNNNDNKNDNNITENDDININLLKFYIPLCENIEFYMNDNTIKNISSGNLFLFLDKNINFNVKSKYYLYGLIECI